MAKHGKNRTANPVYSQTERDKDKASGQWGSQKRRAGTDSVTQFDCCQLSSAPCNNPVITPDGYLYDKECILENILKQKADMKRQMKEYEAQLRKHQARQAKTDAEAKDAAFEQFVKKERGIGGASADGPFEKKVEELSQAGKMLAMKKEERLTVDGKVTPKLPAFWLPSLGPDSAPTEVKPPSMKTKCPMSGKPLRIKDLIAVNFKLADKLSKESLAARKERYVCALTDKVLRNAVPCVVLKPTGRVITKEAFEKLVKPDMIEPIAGIKLKMKDVILMASGGTGYASGGGTVKKTKVTAAMMYA